MSWRDLLLQWWPRVLPGLAASATHGVIRTAHAVRSLRDAGTEPDALLADELAQALASELRATKACQAIRNSPAVAMRSRPRAGYLVSTRRYRPRASASPGAWCRCAASMASPTGWTSGARSSR